MPKNTLTEANDYTSDIVNINANIEQPTGIYTSTTSMNKDDKYKGFPVDRAVIPQYTYVLDYGVGMLDVDVNGTLVSVDTQLRPQRAADGTFNNRYIETGGTKLAFANDKQDMIYSIDRTATKLQRYYVLIQRPNGEYDWFAINIVPASNVYYEQDVFSFSESSKAEWTDKTDETSVVTSQAISLFDDIYGMDEKQRITTIRAVYR